MSCLCSPLASHTHPTDASVSEPQEGTAVTHAHTHAGTHMYACKHVCMHTRTHAHTHMKVKVSICTTCTQTMEFAADNREVKIKLILTSLVTSGVMHGLCPPPSPTMANLSPLLWNTFKREVDSPIQAHCIVVAHMDHRPTQQGTESLEQSRINIAHVIAHTHYGGSIYEPDYAVWTT